MSAAKDGVKRRTWSLETRRRIVAEALAPGASVAAVARRHDLNANLIFKWLRRSREGWLDRRRAPAKETTAAQTFIPVEAQPSLVNPGRVCIPKILSVLNHRQERLSSGHDRPVTFTAGPDDGAVQAHVAAQGGELLPAAPVHTEN